MGPHGSGDQKGNEGEGYGGSPRRCAGVGRRPSYGSDGLHALATHSSTERAHEHLGVTKSVPCREGRRGSRRRFGDDAPVAYTP